MKRVVVTGLGIISSIGNDINKVTDSLKSLTSGIDINEKNKEMGLRSHVSGIIKGIDLKEEIDRKVYRFMGDAAAYGYLSAVQALEDSKLIEEKISNHRTGLIMGSGGASSEDQIDAADILRSKGLKRIGPYRVTKAMGSTVSACLATSLGIKGINYSISSACSTSSHCIGSGMEQIQLDKQDIVIVGGGEAEHWGTTSLFDAMGALSTKYNEDPKSASRAFDSDRDGFVIAGGGGAIILEELNHAKERGAHIYAELAGEGNSLSSYRITDSHPNGDGAIQAIKGALKSAQIKKCEVDYINAHGTSTPANDRMETAAIRSLFGAHAESLAVSSTKSMTGHLLGAAAAVEAVFSILALHHGILPPTINQFTSDPECDLDYIPHQARNAQVEVSLSNSLGFGGTNAAVAFRRA